MSDTDPEFSSLVEAIYEAALDPSRWVKFLEGLASVYPEGKGTLLYWDRKTTPTLWTVSSGWQPWAVEAYNQHFGAVNPWLPGMRSRPLGVTVMAESMVPAAEMDRTEFGFDFLRPAGIGTGVGVTVLQDDGRSLAASVLFTRHKGDTAGPEHVRRLDQFVPHLRQAVNIHRRLGELEMRASAVEERLERLGAGVLVVDQRARVLFANTSASRLLNGEHGIRMTAAGGSLVCDRPAEEAQLHDLVRKACLVTTAGKAHPGGAIGISRRSAARPLAVLVCPFDRAWLALGWPTPAAILFVTDPDSRHVTSETVLRALYGLTRAECRVAAALAGGLDIRTIAENLKVGEGTVRQQVKSILSKTDTHRQSELVRLLLVGPAASVLLDD